MENRGKNLSAIDKTVVKVNKKRYYVSLDVERNELILMRVYTARNYLTAKVIKELKYCENKVCC